MLLLFPALRRLLFVGVVARGGCCCVLSVDSSCLVVVVVVVVRMDCYCYDSMTMEQRRANLQVVIKLVSLMLSSSGSAWRDDEIDVVRKILVQESAFALSWSGFCRRLMIKRLLSDVQLFTCLLAE